VKQIGCTALNKIILPIVNSRNTHAMYKNLHKWCDIGYISALLMIMKIQTKYVEFATNAIKNYL
jgi:hypothetical protein